MSTTSADSNSESARARRELLLKVYDAALAEYRFNVQLSWDRTKFFLVLSSGMIAAGVGLIRFSENNAAASGFVALFFICSALITNSGRATLALGKRYYRESVFTKTLVERELGLLERLPGMNSDKATLSIAVTDGQRDYRGVLFGDKPSLASQISPTTVIANVRTIFFVVILIEIGGCMYAASNTINAICDAYQTLRAKMEIATGLF
jgi:hypothetical protein